MVMELLFWLLPACAALWFLYGFGNGLLLNSDNGNHQISSTDNLFRLIAFKQLSTGTQPNISSFANLNIHISDNSTAATTTATTSTAGTPEPTYHYTTTPWGPTHSTEINPSHSVPVISQASIPPTTATAGLPNPPWNPTHPGIFDDPAGIPWDSPTHTLPYRHNLAQPVCWATVQHIPPLV
jgi:hypothetical protein